MPSFKLVSHTACQRRFCYVDGKHVSADRYRELRDACSTRDCLLTVTDRHRRIDGCEAHVFTFEGR